MTKHISFKYVKNLKFLAVLKRSEFKKQNEFALIKSEKILENVIIA